MHEGQYPAECFHSVTLTQPTYTVATITSVKYTFTLSPILSFTAMFINIRTFHKHKIEDMSQKTKQMNSAQILQNLLIFF